MSFFVYVCIPKDAKALLYLHEAGWVHRDISVGNLYLYTDPVTRKKRGLVGDLENAKKVGDEGKSDARTVCDQIYF